MSVQTSQKRITVPDIRFRKGGKDPIVCLTAYTAPMARLLDPHVDLILVGDSVGMVLYGLPNTLSVSLDMMIAHGAAVVRGSQQALVVVDMPFGSYHESPVQAFRSYARVLAETGAAAVKLEGGVEMAETVRFLVERDVPVMGHVGLRPQSIHIMGGYKTQGRDEQGQAHILADAKAIAEAGAFSIVVEGVVESLADTLAKECPVPTIGIGASAKCDGQILVTEDILGLLPDFKPRFVRRFAEIGTIISDAAAAYAAAVRDHSFPGPENVFPSKKG